MADDGVTSAYDNSHRAFLQVFLSKSVLTFEEAKPILAAIITAQGLWNHLARTKALADHAAL